MEYLDVEAGIGAQDEDDGYADFEDVDPRDEPGAGGVVNHQVRLQQERDLVDIVGAIGADEAEVDEEGNPTGKRRFVYAPDCVECLRYLCR